MASLSVQDRLCVRELHMVSSLHVREKCAKNTEFAVLLIKRTTFLTFFLKSCSCEWGEALNIPARLR